jgi:preprotein translocase subunit SecD
LRRWGTILLVSLALAGCTSERVGGVPERPEPTTTGPVDLRKPLELARVVETVPDASAASASPSAPSATGSPLPGPDGEMLTLEPPFLTIERLEDAKIHFQEYDGHWGIELALTDDDARTFGDWTREHVGERAAVVSNGRVIFAPQIQSAIEGGEIVIAAQYDRDEAGDLLAQITGR